MWKWSGRIKFLRFFLREKKKERKKIRSMKLYPRLCSSFLRSSNKIGAPYRRISLLISQVDVSRRSVIHIDPLAPPTQPAGPVFSWLNHHPGLSNRGSHLSGNCPRAPRTRFVPFERQEVPLVASIFDVHPPTWHRLHASSRIFLARLSVRCLFQLLYSSPVVENRSLAGTKKFFSNRSNIVPFHSWSRSPIIWFQLMSVR